MFFQPTLFLNNAEILSRDQLRSRAISEALRFESYSMSCRMHADVLEAFCFSFLGHDITARLRDSFPWSVEVIQLCSGQPLGAESHRLWVVGVQGGGRT